MKRRTFLKNTAVATTAFSIVPSYVLGKTHTAPSDTLYVAAFGIGGRGNGVIRDLTNTGKVKFVALCDVDARMVAESYKLHPKAKRFKDFRKVYDAHLKDIDAIAVAHQTIRMRLLPYPLCVLKNMPM